MKKKNPGLSKLTLNKATIARLTELQQTKINGGQTQAADTCVSSLPPTRVNCPLTFALMTQPCGTQPCGGSTH